MDTSLTPTDKKKIEESIREKYGKVALSPKGLFRYPTGLEALKALGYDPDILQFLPQTVSASYCGVGNPFSLGPLGEGESVLDTGCGAGVDTIVAGVKVGSSGRAVGVDIVSEMLGKARENLAVSSLENVTFINSSAERLPFPDESFDVVISNGAFNLVVDKAQALGEAYRTLKPGGRLMIADQVLVGGQPGNKGSMVESWAG
jgi:arsenite methyltransferase